MDEIDEVLLSRRDKLQQQQDDEAAFGKHIAAYLQQLHPWQQVLVRIETDKIPLNLQFPEDPYTDHNRTTLTVLLTAILLMKVL